MMKDHVTADTEYACGYCHSRFNCPEDAMDCAESCRPFWTKNWDGRLGIGRSEEGLKDNIVVVRGRRDQTECTKIEHGAKRFHIGGMRTSRGSSGDFFIRKDISTEEFRTRLKMACAALDGMIDGLLEEVGMGGTQTSKQKEE
jgi:hypothetical protein